MSFTPQAVGKVLSMETEQDVFVSLSCSVFSDFWQQRSAALEVHRAMKTATNDYW
jgi:hypothetical protein